MLNCSVLMYAYLANLTLCQSRCHFLGNVTIHIQVILDGFLLCILKVAHPLHHGVKFIVRAITYGAAILQHHVWVLFIIFREGSQLRITTYVCGQAAEFAHTQLAIVLVVQEQHGEVTIDFCDGRTIPCRIENLASVMVFGPLVQQPEHGYLVLPYRHHVVEIHVTQVVSIHGRTVLVAIRHIGVGSTSHHPRKGIFIPFVSIGISDFTTIVKTSQQGKVGVV